VSPGFSHEFEETWKQFMRMHWETLYARDFFKYECLNQFVIFGERR